MCHFFFLSKTLIPSAELNKNNPNNTFSFSVFLNCIYIYFILLLQVYTSLPVKKINFCSFVSHGLVHNTENNSFMKDLTYKFVCS